MVAVEVVANHEWELMTFSPFSSMTSRDEYTACCSLRLLSGSAVLMYNGLFCAATRVCADGRYQLWFHECVVIGRQVNVVREVTVERD